MKLITRGASALVAVAVAGGVLLTAGNAFAGPTTSPFDPSSNGATKGSVHFYDAAGNQVYSGALDTPPAYVKADSDTGASTDNTGTVYVAIPDKNKPNPFDWSSDLLGDAQYKPAPASWPASVKDGKVVGQALIWTEGPQLTDPNTDTAWKDLRQIRLYSSGPGNAVNPQVYSSATVSIDSVANTWTQVYPTPPAPATKPGAPTSVVATGGQQQASVAFTAPTSDGGSTITGYTVTSSGPTAKTATGTTSPISVTGLAPGAYTFTVTATNSAGTSDPSAASNTAQVTGPPAPSVAESVSGGPRTDLPYTFTATIGQVSGTVPAGSIAFFDGASQLAGTVQQSGAQYTLSDVTLPVGNHSIIAKFTPTDTAAYSAAQSSSSDFYTGAALAGACTVQGSACSDPQNIETTVPVGTLVINTPYTSSNPLVLPDMTLNTQATELSTSKTFDNIRVTDRRSGAYGWTAKALSSDLTSGTEKINGQNVGLTGLTSTPGAGFDTSAGNLALTSNYAAGDTTAQGTALAVGVPGSKGLGSTPHTFAAATVGTGTVTMQGLLTIVAPTTTKPGIYDGTVTFTVG